MRVNSSIKVDYDYSCVIHLPRNGFRTKSNRIEIDCVRFCSIGSIIELTGRGQPVNLKKASWYVQPKYCYEKTIHVVLNQLCSSLWTSRFWFFIFWLIRSLF